eukprot:34517-Chlamydomonas_euryale.AAC.4
MVQWVSQSPGATATKPQPDHQPDTAISGKSAMRPHPHPHPHHHPFIHADTHFSWACTRLTTDGWR